MNLTKLDSYDYTLKDSTVYIRLDGNTDPTMVDILSELDRSNGRFYVEGGYYLQTGYDILHLPTGTYLALHKTTLN